MNAAPRKRSNKKQKQAARCPSCGRQNEFHTRVAPSGPSHGDTAICFGCHALLIYGDDGLLRACTNEERNERLADPCVRVALKTLAKGGGWEDAERAIERVEKEQASSS